MSASPEVRPDRRGYFRWYHQAIRKGIDVGPPPPRKADGAPPRISPEQYDDLLGWKATHYRTRRPLEALAAEMGLPVLYLFHTSKKRIKRYDVERYEGAVSLMREAVDEARAET